MPSGRKATKARIDQFLNSHKKHSVHSQSRGPMAIPVAKQGRKIPFSKLQSLRLPKVGYPLIGTIVLVVIALGFILIAKLYTLKYFHYSFNKVTGCVTEEVLNARLRKELVYIWSPLLYDKETVYKEFKCLKSIDFKWNPFALNTLQIYVRTEIPVVKVVVMRMDENNHYSNVSALYSAPVANEEVWYFTREGKLIKLYEDQSLYTFRLRVYKDKTIEQIQLASDFIQAVLQIKQLFEKNYNFTPNIDVTMDGSAKVYTNFVEDLFMSLKGDLASQFSSLQLFSTRSRIEKRNLQLVDLRFQQVVVRYK